MSETSKREIVKPRFWDYIIFGATRFLPITKKMRKKLRLKLIKQKEDICLYEAKNYIALQVGIAIILTELVFMLIGYGFKFSFNYDSIANIIFGVLIEYVCFLIVMPIAVIPVYPFTGFWVRMDQ